MFTRDRLLSSANKLLRGKQHARILFRCLLLLLFWAFVTRDVSAETQQERRPDASVFLLDQELDSPTSMNPYLSFLMDAPEDCDIRTIAFELRDQFQPWGSTTPPSFGYVSHPVWMKLSVHSALKKTTKLRLEILNSQLEHVDVYVHIRGNRQTQRMFGPIPKGAFDIIPERDGFRRFVYLSPEFPPGRNLDIYFRIHTGSSLWLSAQMMARDRHILISYRRFLLDQPILWTSAFVAVLSLILAATFQSKLFLYNSLFSASYFIYFAIGNGYARNLISGTPEWFFPHVHAGSALLSYLAIHCLTVKYFQFSIAQLRSLQKVALGITLLLVAMLPICLLLPHPLSNYVVHGVAIAITTSNTLIILRCLRTSFRWNYVFFVLAWICFAVTSLLVQLEQLRLLPILIQPNTLEMATVIPLIAFLFTATSRQTWESREIEYRLAKAMEAESDARLAALRYQINPHFLFNTLASIDALSRIEPEKIPKLIERLADFLRPRLEPGDSKLIPLSSELNAVQAYLEIEQMRFGNALHLTLDTPPITLKRKIPDGILQPLVENAIKHRPDSQDEIDIHIQANIEDGLLHISVANRGKLKPCNPESPQPQSGIGLENVRRRLYAHFGEKGQSNLYQESEQVICRISIPSTVDDPECETSLPSIISPPAKEHHVEPVARTTIA